MRIYAPPRRSESGSGRFPSRGPGDSPQSLETAFAQISPQTDVLMTHSRPFGLLDRTADGRPVGSAALRRVVDQQRPRLHVFGHIKRHTGAAEMPGEDPAAPVTLLNVSLLDERYEPTFAPELIDLDEASS